MRESRFFIPTPLQLVPTAFLQSSRPPTTKGPFASCRSIPRRSKRLESRSSVPIVLTHRFLAFALAVLSTVLSSSLASGSVTNQSVRAKESQQQRIQVATQEIVNQLDALIEEFRSNGITGKDLQTALDIREALDKLAVQDMQRIILLLRETARENNVDSARDSLTAAIAGQKDIVAQLRDLLSKYQSGHVQ